jgi:hypothetical protein
MYENKLQVLRFLKNIPGLVRVKGDPDKTRAHPHGRACVSSRSKETLTRPVRIPPSRVGCARARPARAHHDGGSHWGGVRTPTEACAPLMMGRALYKGAHMHAPPHFHLILGLQLPPRGCLLGSWVEVLGPTSTCCHFFPHKLNF